LRPFLFLTLAVILGGCPEPPPTCKVGFIGDRSKPPEVQILITDGASQVLSPIAPGDTLPLEPPPQGGYVLYVGAAARNVDACNIKLAGTLRDPATGDQLGYDGRTTTLVLGADGWGRSDPRSNSNVANVNACPDYSPNDRHGGSFNLEMKITDRSGRTATVTVPVLLQCMQSSPAVQTDCICTCSANYFLGKCDPNRDSSVAD
jgi:hypothetical protein